MAASVVLFDVGGVLTPDPWETLALTPVRGIAAQLDIDPYLMEQAGEELWPIFCLTPQDESRYWRALRKTFDVAISPELVEETEHALMYANPYGVMAIEELERHGVRWGIVSDNTSFWYPKQLQLLGLDGRVDPVLEFVSFDRGVSKAATGIGLYELAAQETTPDRTVVIDNQPANLERAKAAGFHTIAYSLDQGRKLTDLLQEQL